MVVNKSKALWDISKPLQEAAIGYLYQQNLSIPHPHGQPVLAGVRFMHGMSILMLIPKTMGDFGLYSCKAENEKGSMVYNITVERLCKC